MSEKTAKTIKLVICNEPENCGTVKDLQAMLKEAKEKAEKWNELSPIKTLVATMSSEEVLKALEAQRRLDNALTASDELKQTLRDYAQWESPALREIWKGFNKLDSILREAAEGRIHP